MGLFALDTEKTVESAVECALINLKLFEERLDDPLRHRGDYLLRMARTNVQSAINLLIEERVENVGDQG